MKTLAFVAALLFAFSADVWGQGKDTLKFFLKDKAPITKDFTQYRFEGASDLYSALDKHGLATMKQKSTGKIFIVGEKKNMVKSIADIRRAVGPYKPTSKSSEKGEKEFNSIVKPFYESVNDLVIKGQPSWGIVRELSVNFHTLNSIGFLIEKKEKLPSDYEFVEYDLPLDPSDMGTGLKESDVRIIKNKKTGLLFFYGDKNGFDKFFSYLTSTYFQTQGSDYQVKYEEYIKTKSPKKVFVERFLQTLGSVMLNGSSPKKMIDYLLCERDIDGLP